jgi:hypothetical protein
MNTRNRGIFWTASAALAIGALSLAGNAQTAKPADKPATAHLQAYIEAFNTGSLDRMKAFFEEHFAASVLKETPVAQRLARYQGGKLQLKSLTMERAVSELAFQTAFLVKTGNGQNLLLRATVEKVPPHKLVAITAEIVDDPEAITVPEPKANEREFVSAVRTFLEEKTRADEFSGVVLVAKDARILFHEAYGLADRDAKMPSSTSARSTRTSPEWPSTSWPARVGSRSTTRSRGSCPITPTPRPRAR